MRQGEDTTQGERVLASFLSLSLSLPPFSLSLYLSLALLSLKKTASLHRQQNAALKKHKAGWRGARD